MLNFWGPLNPFNALNPSGGTLEVPVTNCKNEVLKLISKLSNT